jgi:V8-like Glu-specific endopeptidase
MALAVSRFVGRINIRSMPGQTAGFGTGFMVSPRLLLTNNHVLRTERDARYSEVEFDYQYDRYGRLLPVVVYGLEPETLFITSTELDFTLVAVRELSLNGIELRRYGWIPASSGRRARRCWATPSTSSSIRRAKPSRSSYAPTNLWTSSTTSPTT